MRRFSKNSKSLDHRNLTSKHITRLQKAMLVHKCPHGIIYTSQADLPTSIYKTAVEYGIEIVDFENLLRLALRIE